METRTIQIANNKTQRRYAIETSAETLGQLKAQMAEQGIDYIGMEFTEGISKTRLLSDDSLLPTQVMFRGQPTNNLIMLLTTPNKQIASGGYPTERKLFGAYIKENRLGEAIKEYFGDNWTRVSTNRLIDFFKEVGSPQQVLTEKPHEEETHEAAPASQSSLPDIKSAPHANVVNWFYDGLKSMVKESVLFTEDIVVLAGLVDELAHRLWEEKAVVTDDDIDEMMAHIC